MRADPRNAGTTADWGQGWNLVDRILFSVFAGVHLFGVAGVIKGALSLVIVCEILKFLWYTEDHEKTANLLVTAYLLLLFVAYPFYMKEGYVEIGRAKYSFWIRISLSTAAVLLLFS